MRYYGNSFIMTTQILFPLSLSLYIYLKIGKGKIQKFIALLFLCFFEREIKCLLLERFRKKRDETAANTACCYVGGGGDTEG